MNREEAKLKINSQLAAILNRPAHAIKVKWSRTDQRYTVTVLHHYYFGQEIKDEAGQEAIMFFYMNSLQRKTDWSMPDHTIAIRIEN